MYPCQYPLISIVISFYKKPDIIGDRRGLNQHFLPKNIQHFFLIDVPKSGVIIMVEYVMIIS